MTVDLVANTAEFSGDLGKASQAAGDFGKSAEAAGQQVDFSMREAKGSMMLLGEELGVHIPRHLQALIAQIPMVGAAFAEMLPIVGVIAAIAIIAKLIAKNEEAKEKLAQGWDKFGYESAEALGKLDDKMLEVSKHADELAGRHLSALKKELELIDRQSMHELIAEFAQLSKAADGVLTEMKSSWYEIRIGSQGAQNALDSFRNKYDLLIASGNGKGASELLRGTLETANNYLTNMQKLNNEAFAPSAKALDSQRALVQVLEAQVHASEKIAEINTGEKANVKTADGQAEDELQNKLFDKQQKHLEERRRAEATYAKEQLEIKTKAAKEAIKIEEEEAKATEAVMAQKLKEITGLANEEMKQAVAMAKIKASAEEQEAKHSLAMRTSTLREATELEIKGSQEQLKVDLDALNRESAFLSQYGEKDLVKIREIEDKKTQIMAKAALDQTKIREDALQKQYQSTARVEQQMSDAIAKNLTKGILESQNMGTAFKKMGADMLESAVQTTMRMILLNKEGMLSDAGAAASAAYKAGMKAYPSPFNMVIAPIQAAAAFSGAMKFEKGGEIPGSGAIPIIGHGGETVVTKALSDQVKNNTGGGRGGHSVNVHTTVHAVDASGFEALLNKHAAVVSRHVNSQLRKMNKKG